MRMSKAVLIIFIVPLNYCIALFAHPSQMLCGSIISTSWSSTHAYANSETSHAPARSPPFQSHQMNLAAPPQHSIYFGPPASHPLNGDLNFCINTFLTDPSGGWRTLQASIETLLVRCGTQLWNIYIHFGAWQCQSDSKLATRAQGPPCVWTGKTLGDGKIFASEISEILTTMCRLFQCDWGN